MESQTLLVDRAHIVIGCVTILIRCVCTAAWTLLKEELEAAHMASAGCMGKSCVAMPAVSGG